MITDKEEADLLQCEKNLRTTQSNIGWGVINCAAVVFVGIIGLAVTGPLFSEQKGAVSAFLVSDAFLRLLFCLLIGLVICLTAGIILIKSSLKHTIKSFYCEDCDDSDDE
jgi:hypothetical protein